MSEHPAGLLEVAQGLIPSAAVRDHVAGCEQCRLTVGRAIPVDLGYVWAGVTAELNAPAPGLIERVLAAAGVEQWVARFARTSPPLRPAWLLGSAAVVGVAAVTGRVIARVLPGSGQIAGGLAGGTALLVLLLAPLLAAVAVSFSFGRLTDPAHEIVAATPVSPVTATLVRLAAVLVSDSVLLTVGQLGASPGGYGYLLAWFLPMTATALLSALAAARRGPLFGGLTGACTWLAVVLGVGWHAQDLQSALFGLVPQLCYAAMAALLLRYVLSVARRGDWLGGLRSAAASSGSEQGS
jgi:hypothetical protein